MCWASPCSRSSQPGQQRSSDLCRRRARRTAGSNETCETGNGQSIRLGCASWREILTTSLCSIAVTSSFLHSFLENGRSPGNRSRPRGHPVAALIGVAVASIGAPTVREGFPEGLRHFHHSVETPQPQTLCATSTASVAFGVARSH